MSTRLICLNLRPYLRLNHSRPLLVLATLAGSLLTGCAEWERSAYEGLRTRDAMERTPGQVERTAPPPDYDAYKKERESGK